MLFRSAGLQTPARFVETRVLILNPDPVFEDRLLSIFDFTDETETRIVRTMAEVVAILIGESFDGFVIEGEPEFAIEAATVARQHFPSLKILCAPWEELSPEAKDKAEQQNIAVISGAAGNELGATSCAVRKWILAICESISGPCFATMSAAAALISLDAPRPSFTPNSFPFRSSQLMNASRAKIDAAATAMSDSARGRCSI